ncbi:MAG TPA: molybdenum cofactor guanylyltransferase [Longimicrobiales bacterium]
MTVLGVVMAGGLNTRFGDIKAFAQVGGMRIIDRVRAVLHAVADEVVLSANDLSAYAATGLPARPDLIPGLGALGGVHAALSWARERGDAGILAVACDMPFPSVELLRLIRDLAPAHDAVLPESDSRRGLEPLFGYYSLACLPAIEAAMARADRRMIGFHADIDLHHVPLEEVRKLGDPTLMFMNVNTREELELAQRRAAEQHA